MKSIILCEGMTDCVLVQYFMRKVYGWDTEKTGERSQSKKLKKLRTFQNVNFPDRILEIASSGGVSGLIPAFDFILEKNRYAANPESYDKIVIITDRDEIGTEYDFIKKIEKSLCDKEANFTEEIGNNRWIRIVYRNGQGTECYCDLLLLIIPFGETGALETFLLQCVSENDDYDAEIIRKGNNFIDSIDPEKKYLSKRRYLTKSKFDVYFSVRTAAEQFTERQNILKNVEWENYIKLQDSFEKLGDL